jgi:hypothetical protein
MCRPQPVAHPTYLYHTLQSHTSLCSYCDLSCFSFCAYNSFSFVSSHNMFLQVTMPSEITSRKKQQQRNCGWWNRTSTLNSCPLVFAKGRPTSWTSTNSYSVFLIRDSCSSGRNRSDMPWWFGAQDASIGYDAAILSRWISEFYRTTLHMSIIRPALYNLATKTIIKQPKEVPFVVGIMTVEVLTSLTTVVVSFRNV